MNSASWGRSRPRRRPPGCARRAETAGAARAAARQRGRACPREQLIDGLWGEDAAGVGRPVAPGLRARAAPRARRRADRDHGPRLPRRRRGGRARPRPLRAAASSAAERRSRPAAPTPRRTTCARRSQLWRGPALADLPDETRRAAEAERLDELRLHALELRIDAELALGRHDAVVAELEALVGRAAVPRAVPRSSGCSRSTAAAARRRRSRRTATRREVLVGGARASTRAPRSQELERAILRQDAEPRGSRSAHAGRRGRCPCPATPLIGRRLELAAVSALFRDEGARLVTLTGPGGTGKTRLALAVADELEPELRDGAVFVDLAPVSRPGARSCRRSRRRSRCARASGRSPRRDRASARAAAAARPRQLRAAPRRGAVRRRPARRGARACWSWRRAARRCGSPREHEYPVPPLDAPGAGLPFEALVGPTRCGSSSRARGRSIPASSSTTTSAAAVARDLRAARRPAARDRARRRAREAARAGRDPRAARARARPAQRAARATCPRASRRCAPRSTGATTCSAADERQVFARLGVFAGGCTLEAAEARMRRDARKPRRARRQQPAAAARRPLHDARDGSPLRSRAAHERKCRGASAGGTRSG